VAGEEPEAPRRLPGGSIPRHLARPRSTSSNGHSRRPLRDGPPELRDRGATRRAASAWEELDAEDEADAAAGEAAGRTQFRRVIVPGADREVRSGRGPSLFVVALLVAVAVVVLVAVLIYRSAPP